MKTQLVPRTVVSMALVLVAFLVLLVGEQARALYIWEPCCYDFPHASASFGPRLPFSPNSGLRGDLVILPSELANGCTTDPNNYELLRPLVKGNIVLVARGDCTFAFKVSQMQALGARAVVVHDNNPSGGDHLLVMAKDDSVDGEKDLEIEIPSIFVSYHTGIRLLEQIVPAKVDLFRADEEWIGPILDVPAPLLVVFSFIVFALSLVVSASFLRACCRMGGVFGSGQNYAVNNRGLLEPLGSNVVIIDGSSKSQESDDHEQVYYVPVVIDVEENQEETAATTTSQEAASYSSQEAQQQSQQSISNVVALPVDPTDPHREPLLEREQQTQ